MRELLCADCSCSPAWYASPTSGTTSAGSSSVCMWTSSSTLAVPNQRVVPQAQVPAACVCGLAAVLLQYRINEWYHKRRFQQRVYVD